ncbi:DUF2478 domain-containing protein [Bradyrhizobium sp. sBnM-33]|uniref:DUF2478 domain-containing protein n=1 Tax=Bradyrhizobium sp. sBnM-33 TaxID=2831780 RepID=UPI0028993832|nr:DUF2478 domain-containing protein [Bradyrhizobium sp. sBnM-33]WOH52386.1 DUF2478 domain-containing protein [Bradyrhizobium sp. sBnM-33]
MPLLTAVPEKCHAAWRTFTGNVGTTLLCGRQVVKEWWRDIASACRASARVPSRQRLFTDHQIRQLDHGREGIHNFAPENVRRVIGSIKTPSVPVPAPPHISCPRARRGSDQWLGGTLPRALGFILIKRILLAS